MRRREPVPTAGDALREMVGRLQEIPGGVQVFRPLAQDNARDLEHFSRTPSVNRGPATLIFDLQTLREFPNAVPAIDGRRPAAQRHGVEPPEQIRWGARGPPVPCPRAADTEGCGSGLQFAFETMELDLWGFAFYSSLRDLLEQKAEGLERERQSPPGAGISWLSAVRRLGRR